MLWLHQIESISTTTIQNISGIVEHKTYRLIHYSLHKSGNGTVCSLSWINFILNFTFLKKQIDIPNWKHRSTNLNQQRCGYSPTNHSKLVKKQHYDYRDDIMPNCFFLCMCFYVCDICSNFIILEYIYLWDDIHIHVVTSVWRYLTDSSTHWPLWPLLLTWFNFNPSMDK